MPSAEKFLVGSKGEEKAIEAAAAEARKVLGAWIASDEGQRDAYRPSERILPSHFSSKNSWDRYLDELRRRRRVQADLAADADPYEQTDPDTVLAYLRSAMRP